MWVQSSPPKPLSHLHTPITQTPLATPSAPIPQRFGHCSLSQLDGSAPFIHMDPGLHLHVTSIWPDWAFLLSTHVPRDGLHVALQLFSNSVFFAWVSCPQSEPLNPVLHSQTEFLHTPLFEQPFGQFEAAAREAFFAFSCDFSRVKLKAFNCLAFPPSSIKLVAFAGACCNIIFLDTIDSQAAPYQPFSQTHWPSWHIPCPPHSTPLRIIQLFGWACSLLFSQASPSHSGLQKHCPCEQIP